MPLRRHLCFLDVGHGNSTVLIAGEANVVVVDVGRQSTLSEFLLQQEITRIDSIYLSHADADHVGALIGIIATRQVSIGRVLFNGDGSKDTETWEDLAYELDRACNAGLLEAKPGLVAGEMEELPGDVCLRVLGPSVYLATKGVGGKDGSGRRIRTNSISAVISIAVAGDTLALLPGDIDGVGLDDLLENGIDIRASVLVYPHHGGHPGGSAEPGSYASTLLGAVNPRLVVFSIGRGRYATPNPETVRAVRDTAPDVRIVCTQLSEHCAKELPDQPATHLSHAFARGRAGKACCGGTVVIPLDDLAAVLPEASSHGGFIGAHAPTALCSQAPVEPI
ncbi:MAG: MBL fold metallo-hydrolase [Gammaproteobacteria bacterium]|nr:MBL fold metallo-hydrolase [Gammaproteobacteria bacterium]